MSKNFVFDPRIFLKSSAMELGILRTHTFFRVLSDILPDVGEGLWPFEDWPIVRVHFVSEIIIEIVDIAS